MFNEAEEERKALLGLYPFAAMPLTSRPLHPLSMTYAFNWITMDPPTFR